jgi:hypothetical protein
MTTRPWSNAAFRSPRQRCEPCLAGGSARQGTDGSSGYLEGQKRASGAARALGRNSGSRPVWYRHRGSEPVSDQESGLMSGAMLHKSDEVRHVAARRPSRGRYAGRRVARSHFRSAFRRTLSRLLYEVCVDVSIARQTRTNTPESYWNPKLSESYGSQPRC